MSVHVTHRIRKIIQEIDKRRMAPFDYILGDTYRVDYLIADEDMDFRSGDAKSVKMRKVNIPKNTVISISPYGRHGVGQVISIGEEIAMPAEVNRSADYALFVAGVDGSVKKDDLLGVVMFVPFTAVRRGY